MSIDCVGGEAGWMSRDCVGGEAGWMSRDCVGGEAGWMSRDCVGGEADGPPWLLYLEPFPCTDQKMLVCLSSEILTI